jgi:hypothetical protein
MGETLGDCRHASTRRKFGAGGWFDRRGMQNYTGDGAFAVDRRRRSTEIVVSRAGGGRRHEHSLYGIRRQGRLIGLGLRQLREALDRKADEVQREFSTLSDTLAELTAELLEYDGEARTAHLEKIKKVKAQQVVVAEEINTWRERARHVIQTRGGQTLRTYIEELKSLGEENITRAADQALWMMDSPEEAMEFMAQQANQPQEQTPVGRLLERGRTEYDLRVGDRTARVRAAVEFANRPGMIQNEQAIEEIEAAQEDSDPLVRELAVLTSIHLNRARAMGLADLDQAFDSVKRLARVDDPAVIPALVEVVNHPRSGFTLSDTGESQEGNNGRARMVALLRLVELHTPEAKAAVHGRQTDRNKEIATAARRALELFPGPWRGPLKRKAKNS